jgi:hypothetical protein
MIMEGSTIKTLAEYIAKLNRNREREFKEYANDKFDTNGVEQDHVETGWTPEVSSEANKK